VTRTLRDVEGFEQDRSVSEFVHVIADVINRNRIEFSIFLWQHKANLSQIYAVLFPTQAVDMIWTVAT